MKFKVTMKAPDTLYDCIGDAVKEQVASIADPDEREAVAEVREGKMRDFAAKFFEYGEYLTVELDTEAGTCVVVSVK